MKLLPSDVSSALWQKLVEYHEPLLKKARARLENPRITEAERIELAWKIAGLKDLLNLAVPDEKKE